MIPGQKEQFKFAVPPDVFRDREVEVRVRRPVLVLERGVAEHFKVILEPPADPVVVFGWLRRRRWNEKVGVIGRLHLVRQTK